MLELDLSADIQALRSTFADIKAVVDVEALTQEIARLSEEAGAPDLWDDVEKAQKITSALSHRQSALKRITDIEQRLDDLDVLVELANEMDDEDSAEESRHELAELEDIISQLEVQTLLDGEYDDRSAVVTIRSGAGGDDATDFAEMLMRMYLRWAERHKYP
ncbi:MAG: PCRF domain-containing protein, partial [Microbacterium sp.]